MLRPSLALELLKNRQEGKAAAAAARDDANANRIRIEDEEDGHHDK
jgi:hypothetical protein